MRILVVILIFVLVWAPASVFAEPVRSKGNRGDCRRMTKQIDHYEHVVLAMAKQRGNKAWQASMEAHLSELKNRRADRCPEWNEQRKLLVRARNQARQMQKLIAMAGKAAAKYFTGGWL